VLITEGKLQSFPEDSRFSPTLPSKCLWIPRVNRVFQKKWKSGENNFVWVWDSN